MNIGNGIKNLNSHLSGFVSIMVIVVVFSVTAFAGEAINARYLEPRGRHIIWEIAVPTPSPAAIIVTQYILPESEISETSHPLSSYDREAGIAKWLLTSISPGPLKMEMTVSKAIRKKGEIHGEVMFQDANNKTMASVFMKVKKKKKAIEGC